MNRNDGQPQNGQPQNGQPQNGQLQDAQRGAGHAGERVRWRGWRRGAAQHGDAHKDRRPRRALPIIAALVGALLLSLGPAHSAAPAHAATCVNSSDQAVDCPTGQPLGQDVLPHDYGPPALLNFTTPLYAASAPQIQALRALEQQAVTAIVQAHGLPTSDAAAVQSWGRADAEAALWALLVQAIQTPVASRSADQQNAVDWLTAVAHRQDVQAANAAGLEYVKWAGFDQAAFQRLLTTNPSQSDLQAFLSGTPLNYNNPDKSQATGGYCVYQSPAPYQSEYTANIYTPMAHNTASPTCFNGGSIGSLFGGPPTPSYDQFVRWGTAAADAQIVNTSGFAQAAGAIALGATLGASTAVLGAGIGTIAAGGSPLADLFVGSAFQQAIIPLYYKTVRDVVSKAVKAAVESATRVAEEAGTPLSEEAVAQVTAEATADATAEAVAMGGALTAGSIASIASVLITAITVAVEEGINVANAANLPGQLAALIAGTSAATPDLAARLSDAGKMQVLYALFVDATLPAPRFATCDNALLIGGPQGTPLPCLNAPPVPDSAPSTDPSFAIAPKGATTTTTASSFTWVDAASQVVTTARLHGPWFIDTSSADPTLPTTTAQTLHIHYSAWDGVERSAWLVYDPQKGYMFLSYADADAAGGSVDPTTCVAAGTCLYSPTIEVVGPDGRDYGVGVIPAPTPMVAPTYDTPALANTPITFAANGTSPSGLDTTYQWRFERPGFVTACAGAQTCAPSYAYGDPVSGAQVQHSWDQAGTFHVELTATDAAGRATVDTFAVDVAVTPTLRWNLAPAIRYGTPLDGALLNAAATLPGAPDAPVAMVCGSPSPGQPLCVPASTETPAAGVYAYSVDGTAASPGAVLPAARHRLQVQFTPSDAAHTTTPAPLTRDLNVETAPLTVTARDQRMTYGDAVPSFDPDVSGLVGGDTIASVLPGLSCGSRTSQGPISSSARPDQYHIDCTFDTTHKPANYRVRFVPGTLTIDAAPLRIQAQNKDIDYGEAMPPLDASYSGFVNGDTESQALDFRPPTCHAVDAAGQPLGSHPSVGTYPITCDGAITHAYRITYKPAWLEVRRVRLTVTARDQRMTYGDAVPSFDADVSGLVGGDTAAMLGLSCTARDGAGPVSSSSLPRQYPIGCTVSKPDNYDVLYTPGTLTIDAAPLTITANDQSMVAGGPVPAFTADYSGFVNGDTESQALDFRPPTCQASDGSGQPISSGTPAGTYPITCTGAASHAYRITYVPGTLTIDPTPASPPPPTATATATP